MISVIYKDRWQIELFSKTLRQNLEVKSKKILFIKIWTALIAMLLITYLKFKSIFNWSLSNLVAFLRWNLFTYKKLWRWIDKPFNVLLKTSDSVQFHLTFKRIGLHRILNAATGFGNGSFLSPKHLKFERAITGFVWFGHL